jgi:hypothetical protein
MEIGWFEKKIGMGMCYGFNRRTGRTEWNGRASAQVRRGGVAGLFFVDHLPFWAIRCSIGWGGSGLRWLRWPISYGRAI